MAQPTNTFSSNDAVGIREDLSDRIYDISPDETPLLSRSRKTKAKNKFHEWQSDALRTATLDNAHIEGADTVADSRTPTVRHGNYLQIFKNAVVVPDSDTYMNKAGRAGEMAYQVAKTVREQKLDIEMTLFANRARDSGSDSGARKLGGLPCWIVTNTVHESGSSGADPTGTGANLGTTTRTDDGTPVAFSQTRFDTLLQEMWTEGAMPQTVYLRPDQMDVALGFNGNNNQRNTSGAGKVVNDLILYTTPWGKVKWQLSRYVRSSDVIVTQDDMVAIAVGRGARTTPLAKTGDNTKRQVVQELTLCVKNEKALGIVADNS